MKQPATSYVTRAELQIEIMRAKSTMMWRCVLTTIAIHAVVIVLIVQSFQSGWRPH